MFPGPTVRDNLQIGQWLAEPARARSFAGEGTIEDRVFSVFPEVAALTERDAPPLPLLVGLDVFNQQRIADVDIRRSVHEEQRSRR